MLVLFINSINKQCGVYQYGVRLYNILQKCPDIEYKYFEIDNIEKYRLLITQYSTSTHIIYNYHTVTMGWLNNNTVCKTTVNIGIPHESSSNCFNLILNIDPNGLETKNAFNIPRPIYENVSELLTDDYKSSTQEIHDFINYKENEVPIFGSFGFGFQNKGFDKIVDLINKTHDNAIIKFIMPFAHYDPNAVNNYNTVYTKCLKYNVKPGIKLMTITAFCSNEDILYFLKSNYMNIFLYDSLQGRGTSSVIDYALSVNTPFGISNSYMFRHIYSDEICLYKTELSKCYSNSLKHVELFQVKNSHKNVICKFKEIMNNTDSVKSYKPLTYLSGGRLGDLIHNLSVINENFYKTGRKGILYISDSNDKFEFDIQNTYNDTNNVISSQQYIETYKIHANEPFDINLNDWRMNPLLFSQNFCNTYSETYNIEWGKHQWIKIPVINYALKDKILINVSITRFKHIDYNQFKTKYGEENLIFICFDKKQYINFRNRTKMDIKCMRVNNFNELCIAINSCKLFIGTQSMPLAVANALFHDSVILLDTANNKNNNVDLILHENFNIVFKNVIDII
jgi:hypothetical protein